jgi:hypothetical protein
MWQVQDVRVGGWRHVILLHVSTAPYSSCTFFGANFPGEGLRFGSTKIKDDPWSKISGSRKAGDGEGILEPLRRDGESRAEERLLKRIGNGSWRRACSGMNG